MGWGIPRSWRQAAALLALCGVLAYSGLIPGHVVSQLITSLGKSEVVAVADMGCHDEEPGKTQPANGAKKHCPFCAGFAAFQLVALGLSTAVAPPKLAGGDVLAVEDDTALRKSAITPQSRGPPLLPA